MLILCYDTTILDHLAEYFLYLAAAPSFWFSINSSYDHEFHLSQRRMGSDRVGSGRCGVDRVRSGWVGSGQVGLGRVGPGRASGWVGLGRVLVGSGWGDDDNGRR